MVDLEEGRRLLRDAASGHCYMGACPDEVMGWDSRDPACPMCSLMDAFGALLDEAEKHRKLCLSDEELDALGSLGAPESFIASVMEESDRRREAAERLPKAEAERAALREEVEGLRAENAELHHAAQANAAEIRGLREGRPAWKEKNARLLGEVERLERAAADHFDAYVGINDELNAAKEEVRALRACRYFAEETVSDLEKLKGLLDGFVIPYTVDEDCSQIPGRKLTCVQIDQGIGYNGFVCGFYFTPEGEFWAHGVWE